MQSWIVQCNSGLEPRSESDSVSSSHGDVTFVQRDESAATAVYAVKKQRIRWPKAFATEMAYRELRVLLQLRSLADRGLCANFVRIIEWFKGTIDGVQIQSFSDLFIFSQRTLFFFLFFKKRRRMRCCLRRHLRVVSVWLCLQPRHRDNTCTMCSNSATPRSTNNVTRSRSNSNDNGCVDFTGLIDFFL